MNIEKIKLQINSQKNKQLKFKYNGNRNQTEEFDGVIVDNYKSIFLIKLNNDNIRSFTYSDILIGNLEIK